jgi:hypothetical protein
MRPRSRFEDISGEATRRVAKPRSSTESSHLAATRHPLDRVESGRDRPAGQDGGAHPDQDHPDAQAEPGHVPDDRPRAEGDGHPDRDEHQNEPRGHQARHEQGAKEP